MLLLDAPRAPAAHRAKAVAPAPRRGVAQSIAIAALALALAVLLDAEALEDTASAQPLGWRRDLATAVMEPVADVSRALHLTTPRRWLEDAFDRPHPRSEALVPSASTTVPPVSSSTSTPSSTTPTTAPVRRTPTATAPLRMLVAGDSMTEATGPAVLDVADATGVVQAVHELRYSSGLTRPDYFDWPARLTALIAEQDPEVIVVMMGANDAQGIQTPTGPARFGSDAWTAEYRSRVAATMTLLEADDRIVYWIGQPVMRSGDFDERMHHISEIYRREAQQHPRVRYLDTRALLADVDGSYTAYLPGADGRPTLVRREDGIHLTSAGAQRVAGLVMEAVADDWSLPGGGS